MSFDERLEVPPQVLHASQGSLEYTLCAVIEHHGEAKSGHFVTFRRLGEGWFRVSDEHVQRVDVHTVLRAHAYLLFFERDAAARHT